LAAGRLHDSAGRALEGELFAEPAPNQDLLTTVLEAGSEVGGARLTHAWTTDIRVVDGVVGAVMTARADHPGWPEGAQISGPDAGPGLLPHEQDYTGLAALDPYDADALVLSTPIDPRDGRALARRELFRGRTEDAGATWRWEPLTEDSAGDNLRPIIAPGDPA